MIRRDMANKQKYNNNNNYKKTHTHRKSHGIHFSTVVYYGFILKDGHRSLFKQAQKKTVHFIALVIWIIGFRLHRRYRYVCFIQFISSFRMRKHAMNGKVHTKFDVFFFSHKNYFDQSSTFNDISFRPYHHSNSG